MSVKISGGAEILDLDDLIETQQLAAADSKEAAEAVNEHLNGLERSMTAGGIIIDSGAMFVLKMLAGCALSNATAAHKAATDTALARLEGVR